MSRHDPSKVLLGLVYSSDRVITSEFGNYSDLLAGRVVGIDSSNQAVTSLSGSLLGVSVGRDLSNFQKVLVCREGNDVPIALDALGAKASAVIGPLTIRAKNVGTQYNGREILIMGAGAGDPIDTANVSPSFLPEELRISVYYDTTTAQTVADAVNNDPVASLDWEVEVTGSGTTVITSAMSEGVLAGGSNDHDFVVIGTPVYINPASGFATASNTEDAILTNAKYLSGVKTGIDRETSDQRPVAFVDMVGGL